MNSVSLYHPHPHPPARRPVHRPHPCLAPPTFSDESLNWDTMGWGYWKYPQIPSVNRFKFITRGKFMVNVCNRWAKDKEQDLQAAWFNGAG